MSEAGEAGRTYLAYNRAENAHDLDAVGRLVAADLHVIVNGRGTLQSASDDDIAMRAIFEAYPDYRREVVEVIGSGRRAAVRWRMTGTPARLGNPPLDVCGVSVISVEADQITEAQLYYDSAALDTVLVEVVGRG